MVELALGALMSYLLGSIPTGYITAKFIRGIDIRDCGSGNIGATNVFRVVGKKWGVGVLAADMLKGLLAVIWVGRSLTAEIAPEFVNGVICGIAAIAGHTWTIWLKFRGGKGVATSLGVLFGLVPAAAGGAVLVWLAVLWWKHYVSLASLVMALSFPGWVLLFYRGYAFLGVLLPISLLLSCFIFYTHRSNIKRLRDGTEKKVF